MTQKSQFEKEEIDIYVKIFNKVFSKNTSNETFYYKHFGNPYKVATPLFNDKIKDEVAGINAFMGAKFLIDQKEMFAAQSCDSAVLQEYRGKGVFSRIISSAEAQFEKDQLDFLFGFPNSKSYPGFIKLGWSHVGDFYRAVLPLDSCKFFQRKFGKKLPSFIGKLANLHFLKKLKSYSKKNDKIDITTFKKCPFTEEDFNIINNTKAIMTKRSSDYYQWKVDNNPSKDFRYIVARDGSNLIGFLIYETLSDKSLDVVDWLCFSNDFNTQKIVLAKMFQQLIDKGISININLVNKTNGEMKLLQSMGFLDTSNKLMKQKPLPLVIKTFNQEADKKLSLCENWICRFLDTDVIIL
jgi:hypothetical protein